MPLTLTWNRRTRKQGTLQDLQEVPLGETTEEYELNILDGKSIVRTVSGLTSPTYTYADVDQTTDFGALQEKVGFRVTQTGKYGQGHEGEFLVPEQYPGMCFWYEPDYMERWFADTADLTTWYDRSPVQCHVVSDGAPPTLEYSEQNGLSVVRFAGAESLVTAKHPIIAQQPRTIFVVYKCNDFNSGTDGLLALNDEATATSGANGSIFTLTPDVYVRGQGTARTWANVTISTWNVVCIRMPESCDFITGVERFTNGVLTAPATTTGSTVVMSTGNKGMRIGKRTDIGLGFDGDLGDIIGYRYWLPDSSVLQIMAYLKARWATP